MKYSGPGPGTENGPGPAKGSDTRIERVLKRSSAARVEVEVETGVPGGGRLLAFRRMAKGRAMRVLIVDDSRCSRRLQSKALMELGITDIAVACDGHDARRQVDDFQPNLILLDWNMPGMDGLTFLRRLRADGNMTPVIMVTVESGREQVLAAIRLGVLDYILKPFTLSRFSSQLREHLTRGGWSMPDEPQESAA